MRKGQNPAKFIGHVAQPERITIAVLNYIPFLSGFYAQTLDILKLCLGSIRAGSDLPYDLMVFDNGSCPEAVDYLLNEHAEGNIQYLVLSEKNLGKGGAWNIMLQAAPGEIIAYSDNDAYFYPGWLSTSMRILEAFPNAGMVTSRPFRTNLDLCTSTIQWAENNPEVTIQRGQFIPWEEFKAFDMSLGQPEPEVLARYQSTVDVRLKYRDLTVQVGASHWQFIAYKSVIQRFLPFSMDRPMGQVKQLDQRLDGAGYLRLMPVEFLAQNMSNRLDWIHRPVNDPSKTVTKRSVRERLIHFPLIKRVLLGIHDRIFRWYYE
jgi:glycosyltransferase involved in cell wall biosynthesis